MKNFKEEVRIKEIEEVKIEKEVLESFIEKMFENNNMDKVFPNSLFIKNKFSFKDNRENGVIRIIDAIGFNIKKRMPLVYEYKRKKDINHIDQARTYLNGLCHAFNGSARHKLEKEINKELKRKGLFECEIADDLDLKIICISPSFGKQISSLSEEEKKEIILSEIKIYKISNVDILQISELGNTKSGLVKSSLFELEKKVVGTDNKTKWEINGSNNETKKWIEEIDRQLLYNTKTIFRQIKNVHGWMTYIYYWDKNRKELAFAINQRKKEVQVCFSLQKMKDEQKSKEARKRFQLLSYKGVYDESFEHEFLINSEETLREGIKLIKEYLI